MEVLAIPYSRFFSISQNVAFQLSFFRSRMSPCKITETLKWASERGKRHTVTFLKNVCQSAGN